MRCLAFLSCRPLEAVRDLWGIGPAPRSAGRSTDMRTFRLTTEFFMPVSFSKKRRPGTTLTTWSFGQVTSFEVRSCIWKLANERSTISRSGVPLHPSWHDGHDGNCRCGESLGFGPCVYREH